MGSRQSLLMALGEFPIASIPPQMRPELIRRVHRVFVHDPNSGIHSAAEWCLRRWNEPTDLAPDDSNDRSWFVADNGHTLITIDLSEQAEPFVMGCYRGEIGAKMAGADA